MADRPIIFSGAMVRALLAGTKTQTRRVLKPQPFTNGFHFDGREILCHCDELPPATLMRHIGRGRNAYVGSILEDGPEGLSGFYVGDRLWVREGWSHDGVGVWTIATARMCGRGGVFYRADRDENDARYWPSIHMPREFSRLTLTVTDVRVQRLQEISEADAMAEGTSEPSLRELGGDLAQAAWSERQVYQRLWDSLHGPDAWAANPWVVAISFTVERRNIDAARPGQEPTPSLLVPAA